MSARVSVQIGDAMECCAMGNGGVLLEWILMFVVIKLYLIIIILRDN